MSRQKQRKSALKGYLERMPPVNWKRLILKNIPYLMVFYVGDKIAWLYRCCVGGTAFERAYVVLCNLQLAFSSATPSLNPKDLLTGALCALAIRLIVLYRSKNAKKYRHGSEYGSARWGNAKDIAPFIDPVYENNIILTASERLTMNSRPKQPKYARNKNVIVIGGSGSGKTSFFIKPSAPVRAV